MADKEQESTPQPGPETPRRPMSEDQPRRDRNDQESGEPVQLDPEQKPEPGQPQPGQPRPEQPPGQPQPGQPGPRVK